MFDHTAKVAYACLSPRTDKQLLHQLCEAIGYQPVTFLAHDRNGQEIYHTNVMMCVAEQFAVICLSSITDAAERQIVQDHLEKSGHEIVDITFDQMEQFAGNMLSIATDKGNSILVMSQKAYNSLSETQRGQIARYNELAPIDIDTIETIGGGSARCMMAQVFLPERA
ncbi:MAG: hypothetical protein EBZ77_10855 [Chitinophagia bacterium]|nr:hypothetical protein [Chitinophagia bacterium]